MLAEKMGTFAHSGRTARYPKVARMVGLLIAKGAAGPRLGTIARKQQPTLAWSRGSYRGRPNKRLALDAKGPKKLLCSEVRQLQPP